MHGILARNKVVGLIIRPIVKFITSSALATALLQSCTKPSILTIISFERILQNIIIMAWSMWVLDKQIKWSWIHGQGSMIMCLYMLISGEMKIKPDWVWLWNVFNAVHCTNFSSKLKASVPKESKHFFWFQWVIVIYPLEWLCRISPHLSITHDDVIKWKHFPRYWSFVREFSVSRWIPRTKASDAELWCFLWSAPE